MISIFKQNVTFVMDQLKIDEEDPYEQAKKAVQQIHDIDAIDKPFDLDMHFFCYMYAFLGFDYSFVRDVSLTKIEFFWPKLSHSIHLKYLKLSEWANPSSNVWKSVRNA